MEVTEGLCGWDFVVQSLEAERVLPNIVDNPHGHIFLGQDVQGQVPLPMLLRRQSLAMWVSQAETGREGPWRVGFPVGLEAKCPQVSSKVSLFCF